MAVKIFMILVHWIALIYADKPMQWKVMDIRILHTCSVHDLSGQMVGWPWQRGRPASSWQPNCKQWAQIRPNCKRGQRSEPMRQCDDAAEPKWATFATQLVLKVVPPLVWMSICMRVRRRLNGCWWLLQVAYQRVLQDAYQRVLQAATRCLSEGNNYMSLHRLQWLQSS